MAKINLTRKIFIPIFIFSLMVPQIASAVWWNPFSWFEPKSEEVKVVEIDQLENESLADDNIFPEPVTSDEVVEKAIERVVTIDNPELKAQVNELIAENASLKKQVATLTEQIIILSRQQQKELEKEPVKTYTSEVNPLVDRLEAIKKIVEDLEEFKLSHCYRKTSPTSDTTAFSSSTAIYNNPSNFPDGSPLPSLYGDVKWFSCGEINSEMIPSLEVEQEEINDDIDLLKLRYGVS